MLFNLLAKGMIPTESRGLMASGAPLYCALQKWCVFHGAALPWVSCPEPERAHVQVLHLLTICLLLRRGFV